MDTTKRPIIEQGTAYQAAFDYLNERLFSNTLPPVMLTFSRNRNIIAGYFSPDRWTNPETGQNIAEIAINANNIEEGDFQELFKIMAHEMCHAWQFAQPDSPRPGYHDKPFAAKGESIGLRTISVEDKTKTTGQNVTAEIIPGGPLEDAIAEMPQEFLIPWLARPLDVDPKTDPAPGPAPAPLPKKSGKRSRYTCPACGAHVWGKCGLSLTCNPCGLAFIEDANDPSPED